MNMYDIITKKKRGGELTEAEIRYFIDGYVSGEIPDYQAAALTMAIWFNSMTEKETAELTLAMEKSGDVLTMDLGGFTADKHSTGGVGDKTTLITGPIAAACGVYVPKMSGRGLGHTGGTIDKLESVPRFRTALPTDEFRRIVSETHFAVAGQTGHLVPADKKLYALRDSISAVDSIPLICSSIMSKKLATGADGIVLDVKTGDGAFMKSRSDAEELARLMVKTAKHAGRRCTAVLTDMNRPLGKAVGNAVEVMEAIDVLKGGGDERLREISAVLASEMIYLAGKGTPEECRRMADDALSSGSALDVFRRTVSAQGGDAGVIDDYKKFRQPQSIIEIKAAKSGFISGIKCEETGRISGLLGAGRTVIGGDIDSSAGIVFAKTVGDHAEKGDIIARMYTSVSDKNVIDEAEKRFESAVSYSENKPEDDGIILGIVRDTDIC